MKSVQKIVRNGNSSQVTIIKSILVWLDWLPGDLVVVEVQEDKTLRVYPFDQHGANARGQRPAVQGALAEASR